MSNFYEDNAKAFIDDTFNCDMSFQYNLFEKYLNNAEKSNIEAAKRGKSRKNKLNDLFGNNKFVDMFEKLGKYSS